jgi:hypothetical protein
MSSMRFNATLDTSHHEPPHPFNHAGVVTDKSDRHPQCGGEAPLGCEQELSTWGLLSKNLEDSSQVSVEAMQWVLFCLCIGHDMC